MKALCWQGVGRLAVETVPDPVLLNRQDILVRVRASSVCGSDLHLLNGFVPAMKHGDVIGHEFLGDVIEAGPDVRRHRPGDRVVIDRVPSRLAAAARDVPGAVTIDATQGEVHDRLAEMNAGRGPDCCIEAVGMESDSAGPQRLYDRVKQRMVPGTDRAGALRQAIRACAKGGTVSVAGVFGGFVDKFPMGAVMNKALTLRSGQQHGQKYIPALTEHVVRGDLDPSVPATHRMGLDQGAEAYELFKHRADGCVRAVLYPNGPGMSPSAS